MRYSELKKLLTKEGCYLQREGRNHEIWYSPKTGKTTVCILPSFGSSMILQVKKKTPRTPPAHIHAGSDERAEKGMETL